MTDGRFPERWLNDRRFGRVSPEAQMLFVVANTWSAANRTDGDIRRDDLDLFPRWVHTDRAGELVKTGFWVEDRDGWRIADYAHSQTTAAQLAAAERARAHSRERQARKRLRNQNDPDQQVVTRDVPRDDIGQDRPGQEQDRPGQAAVKATKDETDRSSARDGRDSRATRENPRGPSPAGGRSKPEASAFTDPGEASRRDETRECVDCGIPGPGLLAGKDGQMRCRRHHFDRRAS